MAGEIISERRREVFVCSHLHIAAYLGIFLIQHIMLRLLVWVLYIFASSVVISVLLNM